MAVTQVATTPTGRIAWVWDPYPGSWHDTRAADISGLLDQVQPNHVLADKGYQGTGALTPIRNLQATLRMKSPETAAVSTQQR